MLPFRGLDLGQDQGHYINKDFYGIYGSGRCLRHCVCCALNSETVVRGFKRSSGSSPNDGRLFMHTNLD